MGKRIRQARLAAEPPVSRKDLSGRLAAFGVILNQGAISRVERGERYLMDYELWAIARALRINLAHWSMDGPDSICLHGKRAQT
jgi:HTH-type transcriptional regulator, cell division transcriptional repressor